VVPEAQALLFTGTKTVFLISLDIRPKGEQVMAHQAGTLPWAPKHVSVAPTPPPQDA